MNMTSTKKKKATASRLDALLAGRYEILPFAQLPRPHRLAMAHYMAVDGEAWENFLKLPTRSRTKLELRWALIDALPQYTRTYGDVKFGIAKLPTSDVLSSVIQDPEIGNDWPSWKAYHEWYCSPTSGAVPNHARTGRWPVVLSSHNDETLQDGWHRLHCYVRQRARIIPAIFYPQARHLRAA